MLGSGAVAQMPPQEPRDVGSTRPTSPVPCARAGLSETEIKILLDLVKESLARGTPQSDDGPARDCPARNGDCRRPGRGVPDTLPGMVVYTYWMPTVTACYARTQLLAA